MKYVAYARVSTQKQGIGLVAQMTTIHRYVQSVGGEVVAVYQEKESGKDDERAKLWAAIDRAKTDGATLIVAKLDRLSRHTAFLFQIREQLERSGVQIVIADCPDMINNTMTFGIYATLAQAERELISQRTRAALAERKKAGVKLGSPKGIDLSYARQVQTDNARSWARSMLPMITACRGEGRTLQQTADCLNNMGVSTRRGGKWTPTAVRRVLAMVADD